MQALRIVSIATLLAVAAAAIAAKAGDNATPAVAKTPVPAVLDVTTGDLPKTPSVAVEVRTGAIAPGGSTIWHTHPSPTFNYVESGTGTWEFRGGSPQTRSDGQAIEEPANVVTRIVNHGTTPLRLVIFQVSKPGDPVLVPASGGSTPPK